MTRTREDQTMTSTLRVRKTPRPIEVEWLFEQPLNGIIARRFYLGGGSITLGEEDRGWFDGVLAAFTGAPDEKRKLEDLVLALREGHRIDIWFDT